MSPAFLDLLIRNGVAFDVDGDVLIPLDGTAFLPHAILRAGDTITELGLALGVAIDTGELPQGNDRVLDTRRRQTVACLVRLNQRGIVEARELPPHSKTATVPVEPWSSDVDGARAWHAWPRWADLDFARGWVDPGFGDAYAYLHVPDTNREACDGCVHRVRCRWAVGPGRGSAVRIGGVRGHLTAIRVTREEGRWSWVLEGEALP